MLRFAFVARPAGFEPATSSLEGWRSKVEHWTVTPGVAGSSPVSHPKFKKKRAGPPKGQPAGTARSYADQRLTSLLSLAGSPEGFVTAWSQVAPPPDRSRLAVEI